MVRSIVPDETCRTFRFLRVCVCVRANVHYGCEGAIEHKILPTNQIQTEFTFLSLSLFLPPVVVFFFRRATFFGEYADWMKALDVMNKREYATC